jgi:hypothetical protein
MMPVAARMIDLAQPKYLMALGMLVLTIATYDPRSLQPDARSPRGAAPAAKPWVIQTATRIESRVAGRLARPGRPVAAGGLDPSGGTEAFLTERGGWMAVGDAPSRYMEIL